MEIGAQGYPLAIPQYILTPSYNSTGSFIVYNQDKSFPVFRVDTTNGRVGINCTPTVSFEAANNGSCSATLTSYSTSSVSPGFTVRRARGTQAAPLSLSGTNDRIGSFNFQGHDGTNFGTGSQISVNVSQAWTTSAHGTWLSFQTCLTGSIVNSIRFVCDDNGLSCLSGFNLLMTNVSATYSILRQDSFVGCDTATAGAGFTVTLPDASLIVTPDSNNFMAKVIIVKDIGGAANTKNITIACSAGQSIDGVATKTINTAWGVQRLISDPNTAAWYTF
jgi:hypothetical protein